MQGKRHVWEKEMVKPNLGKENADSVSKRYKFFYVIIYVYIMLLMVITNTYVKSLNFLDSSNSLHINSSQFTKDCGVYELTEGDQHVFIYRVEIPALAFESLDGDEYKLIINGINDNAIKVRFNDQLIISVGDPKQGRSALRSSHVSGSVESSLIQSNNVLTIETYADYRTGISKPIIFSGKADGESAISLLNLLNDRVVTVGFGFMFITSIYIYIIYLLNRRGNRMLQYLSLATFFISFYFLDFLPYNHLIFEYIIMKKFFLLCLSLGVFFYGMTLFKVIQKKSILILPVAQLVYYVFSMVMSSDMVQFRLYYSYFYYSLSLLVAFFLVMTFLYIKSSSRTYILFLHFLTMVGLGVVSVVLGFNDAYFSMSMPIYIMLPVGVLPLIVTFDIFLEKDLRVIREKELRDLATNQSMLDDLTGVWNKRYLETRLKILKKNTVVAILDLDNLKFINDTYGHLAGDKVIIRMTETIRKHIRTSDDICRYGGDEFVVIFEECSIQKAGLIVENIRKSIDDQTIKFNGSELGTSISAGLCVVTDDITKDQVLECADQKLYLAKEKGKNRVEFEYFSW